MGVSVDLLELGLLQLKQYDSSGFLKQQCEILTDQLSAGESGIKEFIQTLYKILLKSKYTLIIAKYFPSLILQIVTENISLIKKPIKERENIDLEEIEIHLENCLILGDLVLGHPDILQFCLQYFNIFPSPFDQAYNIESIPSKRRKLCFTSTVDDITDLKIVQCSYNFLCSAPNIFRQKWNWSEFISRFIETEDINTKWLLCQCIMVLTEMSSYQAEKLKNMLIEDPQKIRECLLQQFYFSRKSNEITYLSKTNDSSETIDVISNHVVNVGGILLPIHDLACKKEGILVSVKSTIDNLRSLALTVASGKAVCLIGPVGCGKTALVEHLANITGRSQHLKKVQLGDQTDSRSLLGTYRCTDIPGEFVWQPGILTQAVQFGHWLLLEDVDCAAIDVASVLSSLLERNVLSVPGYRDSIPIAPGFQLFVTKRTIVSNTGYQKISNATTLLEKHWTQINVEPLSRIELIIIVEKLFPQLKTISSRIIDVFLLFSVGNHQSSLQNTLEKSELSPLVKTISTEISEILSMRSGRLTSTRDLIKWCTRAIINFDVSSNESALKVLQDAIDIFSSSLPDSNSRISLAKAIGAFLGIVETKAEYYCTTYKPAITLQPNSFHIGRAVVPRKELPISEINLNEKKVTFSYTRPSLCLLERISCCVNMKEPVLLVGETGTGKTSSVQYLAKETGNKLIVINMNQQSDSADLLGGYKPVDFKFIISPIRNEFEYLFRSYFDGVKNVKFLKHISDCFNASDWKTLLVLMKQSQMAAIRHFENANRVNSSSGKTLTEKKNIKSNIYNSWHKFGHKLNKLELQIKSQTSLAFSFVEGSLINALKKGYWVLLDEINLASSETLECLSGLLESHVSSISLIERGDDKPIERHNNFTLFACMNPATDVGKRDLPAGLRNRFTEFFIDELTDKNDLLLLIGDYLRDMSIPPTILESIYKFYLQIGKEAKFNLMDGTGQSPHYSLRTLCRALAAAPEAFCGTVSRSLYETMCLSFLTQLDRASHPKVENMIANAVLRKKTLKSVIQQPIPMPISKNGEKHLIFEGYWICQGKCEPKIPDDYILTTSVRKNLRDLARIISLGKLPILLQGDTSVGKTSLISYLAKASGNHCVRINNHQHTDLQEYIGSYATDSSGKLIFREGILVEAMRKGHWIILDELNLAPSDVLEALNRVLDDNKELFIPETQQTVKADPKFMLFATQNPPGLYGGRKLLSRAFRNRFVELHFDEIPRNELETILHQRCHMPLSYCKKVLSVMAELQVRRRGSAAVQGKEGFITLRDLFRWGERYKIASNHDTLIGKYYDWDQHIADEGYLVLAGRVRQPDERLIIQEVIQKHIKKIVDPENLFSLHEKTSNVTLDILKGILDFQSDTLNHIVWTFNMRRLAVLVAKAFSFKEPVLLVGETGCGKTTICQILATLRKCNLVTVNCHMHTESSDFLGGLRPVRQYNNDGKLFEWIDGPLIDSMKAGQLFLTDEISLADDSVLERLNSLLEPERQILLAEKGISVDDNTASLVTATDEFRFIGTMNPGGDYGKKELSPALRNRFTEIWCDHITSKNDLHAVIQKSLSKNIVIEHTNLDIGKHILNFIDWFKQTKIGDRYSCTIRDILSWVYFINETVTNHNINICEAFLHGASLVFLDSFGSSITGAENEIELAKLKGEAMKFLIDQVNTYEHYKLDNIGALLLNKESKFVVHKKNRVFGFQPFFINCGENLTDESTNEEYFSFTAPTTGVNTLRLLRALQLKKAILLEGSPGVGKTSLVTALAKISGHKILRINLSDQTDISDLFGADLPTTEGTFSWREGAFLKALQNGDWILLDELNLAPQSVLEGLNACLDHRGEVFISELGKTFSVKLGTRIFACQNPLKQGGARRGLPKSFLNRFTQVYIDTLSPDDLLFITKSQYPDIPENLLSLMIKFNSQILKETSELMWGYKGSPWELNLRDLQRWCEGIMHYCKTKKNIENEMFFKPGKLAQLLYVDRMRTKGDKERVKTIYNDIFSPHYPLSSELPTFYLTQENFHIGDAFLKRNINDKTIISEKELLILRSQTPTLKSLIQCIEMNWLSILIGPTASGKTSCVQVLSQIAGRNLKILPVTSALDTADLLGGFEQTDYNRHLEEISTKIENIVMYSIKNKILLRGFKESISILRQWESFKSLNRIDTDQRRTMDDETKHYMLKQVELQNILERLLSINKDNDNIVNELNDMKIMLQNFNELVGKEKSINAGGKFEWVDSLLVKCLLDGSWLLIDNVNLCSSAVLDRLNGLLESHGVLNISERADESSDIKPHPNFRMFFTMDPRNGEISRAMRNRGVEIYIFGPEDFADASFTDSMPFMDLQALLKSVGLPSKYHNLFLINHKQMCEFIKNYDKPSQCHLLQAAYLTCQQICRGENIMTAIINSFSDVYIKSCNGIIDSNLSIAEYKNEMLKSLKDNVNTFFKDEQISEDIRSNFEPQHTLSCKMLHHNLSLEKIKQESFILISNILKMNSFNINQNIMSKLSSLFYDFYSTSSLDDINLRYEYINCIILDEKSTINDITDNESSGADKNIYSWCQKLNKEMFFAVKQQGLCNAVDYPWDLKLLSEIFEFERNDYSESSNKLDAYLYHLSLNSQRTFSECNDENFSIITYSKYVLSGAVYDDYANMPLLKNCTKLFQFSDDLMKNICESLVTSLDDEDWCKLIESLCWINRFHKSCEGPLYEFVYVNSKKKRIVKDESVKNVILHYKWLQKFLFSNLKKLDKNFESMSNLSDLMLLINKSLATLNSPFKSISKHMRKKMGQSALYSSEECYSSCKQRDELLNNSPTLKLLNRSFNANDIRMSINFNTCIQNIYATENVFDFPSEYLLSKIEEIREKCQQPESEMTSTNLKYGDIITDFCHDAQLWPVKNFILQKTLILFKNKLLLCFLNNYKREKYIHEKFDEIQEDKILSRLFSAGKSASFLPSKLLGLFSDFSTNADSLQKKISSIMDHSLEIMNAIDEFQSVSPSLHSTFWLNCDIKSLLENDEEGTEKQELMPFNLPHLAYNITKLIFRNQSAIEKGPNIENSLVPASLNHWKTRSKQLFSLHHLLWKNMILISSPHHQQMILDSETVIINFERMIVLLEDSIMHKTSSKDVVQNDYDMKRIVNDCVNHINQIYESENKYFTTEMVKTKDSFNKNLLTCLELHTQLQNNLNLKSNSVFMERSIEEEFNYSIKLGSMWTLLSLCSISIYSEIGTVDIVKKDELKLSYIHENIKHLESLLDIKLLQSIVKGNIDIPNNEAENLFNNNSDNEIISSVKWNFDESDCQFIDKAVLHKKISNCHPHYGYLVQAISTNKENMERISKSYTYRPSEPSFSELSKEMLYFVNSLGTNKIIMSHYNAIKNVCENLLKNIIDKCYNSNTIELLLNAEDAINKYSTWHYSVENFYNRFSKKYVQVFPDLTQSFLNTVSQLIYGFEILKNCLTKMIVKVKFGRNDNKFVDLCMENIVRFPIFSENFKTFSQTTDTFLSGRFIDILKETESLNNVENAVAEKRECYRLLKVYLQELNCEFTIRNYSEKNSWNSFQTVLTELVVMWQKYQEEIEKKKQEEDALYVTKTKCDDLTEEEQTECELKEMFPSYTDIDFSDFKNVLLESKDKKYDALKNNKENRSVLNDHQQFFSAQDIDLLINIHSTVVKKFTVAEWLPNIKGNKASCDYLAPLLERYKTFNTLLDSLHLGLNESLDSKMLPSLLILIAYARSTVDGEDHLEKFSNTTNTNNKPSFYHSSWVQETKKCLPTLELIKSRTADLLDQWPDFPTLKDIMVVIDRILNFPVTSPVVRFLTGFELLRDKIEEWNKGAHKGNNMIDLALIVAQHIVSWRKLELTNWKDSLNNAYEKVQSGANKWWFHIYTLVDSFISEKPISDNIFDSSKTGNDNKSKTEDMHNVITLKEFVSAMQQFIEKSPLAEFSKRLDLLYIFHCHAVHFPQSSRRDELISVLWNLHKYYSQFAAQIVQVIKDKRTPIEKKLRDFVKICTWERDLSYWAVKALVDKAHKTLHKHTKEFEVILQISVNNFLVDKSVDQNSDSVGLWDRPKRVASTPTYHFMIDPQQFLVSSRIIKKYITEDGTQNIKQKSGDSTILSRLDSLTLKAKNICKTIISESFYPNGIQSLDGFITMVIDTAHYLKSLEVSPNLPKEKQKNQIKGFIQQKRKLLSDLFRNLQKLGLSYRTGLVEIAMKNGDILNFNVLPVDLESSFTYLKNRRCDTVLLSLWQGCDQYYQRCIARMGGLTTSLLVPSPELGLQNVERIKGYSAHLMILIQEQKLKISKYSRKLCILRHHITSITELCESESHHSDRSTISLQLEQLIDAYCFIIMTLEHFCLVLQACPEALNENAADIAFDTAISNNSLLKSYKFDSTWSSVNDKVNYLISVARKQRDSLNNIKSILPSVLSNSKKTHLSNVVNLCQPQLETIDAASTTIKTIKEDIHSLISEFSLQLDNNRYSDLENPIVSSLVSLDKYLAKIINDIQPHSNEELGEDAINLVYQSSADEFNSQIENLVSFILLVIQDIFKKSTTNTDVKVNENQDLKDDIDESNAKKPIDEEEERFKDIVENHLKKELQENISMNISEIHMSQLNFKLNSICEKIYYVMDEEIIICKKQLMKCIPLLEQIVLFAQYFITQQVGTFRVSCKMLSILLNIFTDLTSKGFCGPSDSNEETGTNENKGTLSSGMGLADGEGEKDVSDQIENQDQLDDAKKPGDENKKDDNKDCKEEENGIDMTDDFESHLQDVEKKEGSDDDSDDDADKEMGDTETGADKLDQQLWGSDDDDEIEDDNKNTEKEEKGEGKPTGDKKLEAKENANSDDDVGSDNDDTKRKEKKDINEIDEPEYDDDQVDPYHGNQKPLPEPEPLDLPDETNLDDHEDDKQNDDETNENPFEIDAMKDKAVPEDGKEEQSKESDEKEKESSTKENLEGESEDENEPDSSNEPNKSEQPMDVEDDSENAKQDEENPETEELNDDEENKENELKSEIPDKQFEDDQKDENDDSMKPDENKNPESAKPSNDEPTSEDNVENTSAEKGSKDMVQTNMQVDKEKEAAPFEQSQEQDGDEQEGIGQSELSENQKGHMGNRKDKPQSNHKEDNNTNKERQSEKRNKPGTTEEERALGEIKEPVHKKMKTINTQNKDTDNPEDEEEDGYDDNKDQSEADIYQHIKQAKESDAQVIDAATKEQAEMQPVPNKPEDEIIDESNPDKDTEMDNNEDVELNEQKAEKIEPEKIGKDKNKNKENISNKNENQGEEVTGDIGMDVEGETIPTIGVERGSDTSYHTKLDMIQASHGSFDKFNTSGAVIRESLQSIGPDRSTAEDNTSWHLLWGRTSSQARLLTEKLRLVLEPTGLSRLAGDYRTGRRINMRRVIPYIASHFRKDRIWLRRTKPARREYHIAVAIDDSSSMCDNQSKELAFESLALISQALNLLEAGDLAVVSFGEDTKILHSFNEQFTESSGSKLLQNLTFKQNKTRIAQMLDFTSVMFEELCSTSNNPNAKLLLIVSDGRGIFSEGETKVLQTIRKVRQSGIFVVYLIVDNPKNDVSIMDIRVPVFDYLTNQLKTIQPYLDTFPFPFYLILRDITALPSVLSDAMRQWFELAANIDRQ